LKQEPEDLDMRYHFAIALRQSGANAEAIRELKELLQHIPSSSGLRYNLGLALENEGKSDEARSQLAEAVRLAPDDPKPKEALARLSR
jgi:Flp pilus assembly protein TadD